MISDWITNNYIEVFGAVTGILYVFLEIRQTIWLWPVGIITSAVYIWVFFTGKLYADMSLQVYYLVISILGWYWWAQGSRRRAQGSGVAGRSLNGGQGEAEKGRIGEGENGRRGELEIPLIDSPFEGGQGDVKHGSNLAFQSTNNITLTVTHLKHRTGFILVIVFSILFILMYIVLNRFTDSPVPGWDSFITSLSIVATWMLARKIYEHWFLWIVVNTVATGLFLTRGLYPTVILYFVYGIMSFAGLNAWRKTISSVTPHPPNPSPG